MRPRLTRHASPAAAANILIFEHEPPPTLSLALTGNISVGIFAGGVLMFAFWLLGVAFGAAQVGIVLVAVASGDPVMIAFVAVQAVILIFLAYGFAYIIAKSALAGAVAGFFPNGATANPLPDDQTELCARAFSVGLTAALNTAGAPVLGAVLVPEIGLALSPLLGPWAFIVTSLAAIPTVSQNRFYQGVLGWSGWIFPLSLIASVFGFIWFAINLPFAIASGIAGGGWPFRIDWSTGAIETVGGLTGLISVANAGAGTVGHFVFVLAPFGANPATFQQAFVVAAAPAVLNVPAHETGHTLDYTAFGGFRVLFAAIDQLVLGNSFTAYSELTADSHVPNRGRIQVRVWS